MKKYLNFFKMRFLYSLQYRTAAAAGVVTQFFWGFMEILLFKAFYESDSSSFPMELSQLASYIWLQQAFMALFMLWSMDNEIFKNISDGNIAYELTRPVDLYSMWFTKNIALRLSSAALRCLPILIVAWFLPEPYRMSFPKNPAALGWFLITSIMSLLLVCAFCMIVYTVTFYTINPTGVRLIALSFTEILTGAIVPLPFFPDKIRTVIELTPFGSMQNLPLRIYSGDIAGAEMYKFILVQLIWLFVITVTGKRWLNKTLKHIVIQGG